MKRTTTLLTFCLFLSITLIAQTSVPKLSPLTKKYLKEIKKFTGEQLLHNYVYKTRGNTNYVSAFIKVNNSISDAELHALNIQIGTRAGKIWTVQVPIQNVDAFTQLSGIDYIQLDEPSIPHLDFARGTTRVDSVHGGFNLPIPYNGAGVIVGVVDAGFDFGHPSFFDTTGTVYRVKQAWLQKNNTGPTPAGYAYGTEITDSTTLWNVGYDNLGTHGTHVGGICAGSGFGSPTGGKKFRGMAYKADMVFVGITPDKSQWVSTGATDMIDGINYIFNYATSVSKPAVVNLSWGSPLGPRDGTGLFSQALDNLTGAGKIFVCSAGNNGGDSIHIQQTFTSTDTIVQTFLRIEPNPEGKKTWVDMWGDSSKTFCAEVALYNNGEIASTGFVCLDDSMHDFTLLGINNDTCFVSITTSASEFNNRPRIFLDFDNRSTIDSICIRVKGTDGTINFWNTFVTNTTGYYGAFLRYGYSWATNGNNVMTMSDIASSKSAISIGAYASKTSWTNISLQTYSYSSYVAQGNLVPFSSHGPTSDNRIKPDITGPGLTVGSAISSYDSTFYSTGPDYLFVINKYHNAGNNRDYPYGMLSGTSMSSPAVSGITALMLQVKPDLDPQTVKDIFTQTAITDGFTGTIPVGGNEFWGNGKVNAYGSVKYVVQLVTGLQTIAGGTLNCNVFPNPNEGAFTIDYEAKSSETLTVDLFDELGKKVLSEQWNVNSGYNFKQFDLKNFNTGVYFINVSSEKNFSLMKMVISPR